MQVEFGLRHTDISRAAATIGSRAIQLIHGTSLAHRKLRSAVPALLAIVVAALALPALASAQVTVSAYPVSTALDALPAAGNSVVEPAIAPAPDGSNAEWFVVSARNQALLSISPTGQQQKVANGFATDAGAPVNYASVEADGYYWVLDNDQGPGNVLYAVGAADSPSPGLNPVARFGDYGQDMTLGPDGSLYVSDNDGIIRCQITAAPSASCATVAVPPPFYTGAGAFAIDGGGNAVWFTDGSGDLGAYASGGFSGPYPSLGQAPASTDPGTVVTAGNGYVYMAGGGAGGAGNSEILSFSPGDPEQVGVVATGLGNVVSMTIGPDGNVWFLDAGGSGSVGELAIGSGTVTQYALPSGMWLPQSGWRIADGPSVATADGTGEVFFTATDASGGLGNAVIGEVSGIPFPVAPGALAFKRAVSVSKRHVAILTLTCSGQSNAACAGRLLLSVSARLRVRAQVRANRKGDDALYRTLTETRRLSLGKVSYSLGGGRSHNVSVRLSNAAYKLLEAVVGHRWNATVTGTPTVGTVSGSQLKMTGPTPPKPKPKKVEKKHRTTKRGQHG